MGQVEAVVFWGTAFTYLAGFIVYLAAAVFKKESWTTLGWYLAIGGFVSHTLAIAARWMETGHPPVMYRFENNLAGTWFVMLLMFVMYRWFKRVKALGLFILPVALVMLGYGLMTGPQLEPLSPPFKSNWLWVHVTFAWLAYSAFAAAGGLGLVYLIKNRLPRQGENARFFRLFPTLALVDDITLKLVSFGFIAQSLMLISGSIWANGLWGSYWQWDPLETWSLVTWLTYGIILHFRLTLGWKGSRIAWLVVAALATEAITFWGIGFISNLHTPLL